jgi:Ca2+-transporting ATPase
MRPGGDELPCVYGGTLVVGGQGVAEVTAVGIHSEIGRVGRSLSGIETEITPLQGRVRSLVKRLSVAGLGLSGAAALLYWFTRGDWLGGLLAGITLAMALLPEELPLILTVFMAMGSWRLSRQRVLTRRAAAIETLGSATMLCTDKTGTLTVNRMRVVALAVPEGGAERYRPPLGRRATPGGCGVDCAARDWRACQPAAADRSDGARLS